MLESDCAQKLFGKPFAQLGLRLGVFCLLLLRPRQSMQRQVQGKTESL